LAAAAAIVGPRRQQAARDAVKLMIDRFAAVKLKSAFDDGFDVGRVDIAGCESLVGAVPDPRAQALLAGLQSRGARSVFVRWLTSLPGPPTADAVLAAITTTLAWGPLSSKRISRLTAESLPWWMMLFGTLIGASADASRHEPGRFCGFCASELLSERSLAEIGFAALLGLHPTEDDLFAFQTL